MHYKLLGRRFERLEDAAHYAERNSIDYRNARKVLLFVRTHLSNRKRPTLEARRILTELLSRLASHERITREATGSIRRHLPTHLQLAKGRWLKRPAREALENLSFGILHAAKHEVNSATVLRMIRKYHGKMRKINRNNMKFALAEVAKHEGHAQEARALARKLRIILPNAR